MIKIKKAINEVHQALLSDFEDFRREYESGKFNFRQKDLNQNGGFSEFSPVKINNNSLKGK